MKLIVTIPAFNEEKTISKVIAEIPKKIPYVSSVSVLVIDDGSTDNTAKIARKMGATVISNSKNMGLAYSFSRGLQNALEMGADIIVNTDADFQYDQRQIPLLAGPVAQGKADIVLGSRFLGTIESMPPEKKTGNMIVSSIMSFLVGQKITDSQTGFRAFSREAAMRINIFSDYTYTQETILEAWENKLSIIEVPVDFRKREGKSRLISNIFVYAHRAGLTILKTYINYKPMKVFSVLGGTMLLAGTFLGLRVLLHYLNTGLVYTQLSAILVSAVLLIVGFQVLVFGMLAEITKRNRKVQEEALYLQKKAAYK